MFPSVSPEMGQITCWLKKCFSNSQQPPSFEAKLDPSYGLNLSPQRSCAEAEAAEL